MRYCNTENTVCEFDIEHIVTLQVSVGVVMAFLYRNAKQNKRTESKKIDTADIKDLDPCNLNNKRNPATNKCCKKVNCEHNMLTC